jgi:hypothetical protein
VHRLQAGLHVDHIMFAAGVCKASGHRSTRELRREQHHPTVHSQLVHNQLLNYQAASASTYCSLSV